jgi:hypothetical protein
MDDIIGDMGLWRATRGLSLGGVNEHRPTLHFHASFFNLSLSGLMNLRYPVRRLHFYAIFGILVRCMLTQFWKFPLIILSKDTAS